MSPTVPAPRVALYVSGHGYGHAVRSAEVARALLRRGARVLLRTEAPRWLFPEGVEALDGDRAAPLDVGVAQRDGLDLDVDRTRDAWERFADGFADRVRAEAERLRAHRVDALLGDMPPLAFAAAAAAGIPSAAVTNFGWDWIYAAWNQDARFDRAIGLVREGFSRAEALLRLPLHSPEPDAFPAFRQIVDVPLVARLATTPRAEVRRALGLPLDGGARVVLLSFGGFDADNLDLAALAAWPAYTFLVTPARPRGGLPPNVRELPRQQVDYVSLTAACDAVVTKPGYGIAADCLANRVPVLYTDRGPFREYDVLAEALERLGPARYVPSGDVRAGHLGPHLDSLLRQPARWAPLALDGAERVADLVLGRLARPSGAWRAPVAA